jgi:hypothetical protein
MSDNIAFVISLQRIAANARSDDANHEAMASFDIYRHQLYRELGIDLAKRPTTSVKMVADCVLSDLRQRILRAEIESAEPLRTALAAVRQRVDMVRRALATQVAEDDAATAPLIGAYEWPAYPLKIPVALSARRAVEISQASVIHSELPVVAAHGSARPAEEDPRCPTLSPTSPS